MIGAVSYDRSRPEQKIIETGCRLQVAKKTAEKLVFYARFRRDSLTDVLGGERLIHFLYYEVVDGEDVRLLKKIRKKDADALLMILAPPELSPMSYCKPGIAPDALLLRPFDQREFDRVNEELFSAWEEHQESGREEGFFQIRTREENCRIPYARVLYFEASNKKIVVRVGNDEFEVYDSIESIAEQAPEYFLRTHRSYLVNRRKIRKANLAEGYLELEQNAFVPVSRTYRRVIREKLG